jgi:hypothetical protein
MRALAVPELLGVWESGLTQGPVERALTLLAAACPDTPRDMLATLSIGRRDASLLTLREWTFGPDIPGLVVCPQCSQTVELAFDIESVRVGPVQEPAPELTMAVADYALQIRAPNSVYVMAITSEPDARQKRQLLFERCLIAAQRDGQPARADELPDAAIDAVAKRLAQADPQADVQLNLSCPYCGNAWRAAFDIVTFFWSEIEAWAVRLLRDVNILASAYGWCERDILALSTVRRQFYIQLAGA